MAKWICNKCGERHEGSAPPIEHGGIFPSVYGKKLGTDFKCNGEWKKQIAFVSQGGYAGAFMSPLEDDYP